MFDAPWQARTFAMAVKLHQAGLFSWNEWSLQLSRNISLFEQDREVKTSEDYYTLWQQTLEQFVDWES